MENKQREERETERPRRRDGHMQNRIHGLLRSAHTLPCTPSLSITHTVSLHTDIYTHTHTHTHIHTHTHTCKGLHRCALGAEERERESLCMDDPVGLVPVLKEPGAKV